MRNITLLSSFFVTSLLLLGAGCGTADSPVSLEKYQAPVGEAVPNNESTTAPPMVQETKIAESENPVTATTSNEATATTTNLKPVIKPEEKNMNNEPEKLAFPGILPDKELTGKKILIKTNKGEIEFELLPKEGPKAASNFVYLVKHKFYDGLTFHRVVPGFVIQGGDPLGTGMGGPGYKFEDDAVKLSYEQGIVAMANAGPNTNGSQFFIMLDNNPLPPSYSIFGRVTKGMDVVKNIAVGDKMESIIIK